MSPESQLFFLLTAMSIEVGAYVLATRLVSNVHRSFLISAFSGLLFYSTAWFTNSEITLYLVDYQEFENVVCGYFSFFCLSFCFWTFKSNLTSILVRLVDSL